METSLFYNLYLNNKFVECLQLIQLHSFQMAEPRKNCTLDHMFSVH